MNGKECFGRRFEREIKTENSWNKMSEKNVSEAEKLKAIQLSIVTLWNVLFDVLHEFSVYSLLIRYKKRKRRTKQIRTRKRLKAIGKKKSIFCFKFNNNRISISNRFENFPNITRTFSLFLFFIFAFIFVANFSPRFVSSDFTRRPFVSFTFARTFRLIRFLFEWIPFGKKKIWRL